MGIATIYDAGGIIALSARDYYPPMCWWVQALSATFATIGSKMSDYLFA